MDGRVQICAHFFFWLKCLFLLMSNYKVALHIFLKKILERLVQGQGATNECPKERTTNIIKKKPSSFSEFIYYVFQSLKLINNIAISHTKIINMLLTILYVSHTHLPFLNEGKDHYKGYLQVHLEIWNAHDRPFFEPCVPTPLKKWLEQRIKKYGPISKLNLFGKPTVFINVWTCCNQICIHQ